MTSKLIDSACCSASSCTRLISDLPSMLSSTDSAVSSQLDAGELVVASASVVVVAVFFGASIKTSGVLSDFVSTVAMSEIHLKQK